MTYNRLILQFPVEFIERQFFTVPTLNTKDEGGHTLKVRTYQNMKMSETSIDYIACIGGRFNNFLPFST